MLYKEDIITSTTISKQSNSTCYLSTIAKKLIKMRPVLVADGHDTFWIDIFYNYCEKCST